MGRKRQISHESAKETDLWTISGETKTVAEWAKSAGIAVKIVLKRHEMGFEIEFCLRKWIRKIKKRQRTPLELATQWTIDGQTLSVSDWSKRSGIDIGTILRRFELGYKPEFCVFRPIKRTVKITHDGKTHTFTEWSRITGIKTSTIIDRYNHGMRPPHLFLPVKTNHRKMVTYNGQTKSIRQWSRDLKLSMSTLTKRLQDGWTAQRAIETPQIRRVYWRITIRTKSEIFTYLYHGTANSTARNALKFGPPTRILDFQSVMFDRITRKEYRESSASTKPDSDSNV